MLVDTTGAVTGEMGRMLKAAKLDLLCPDYVVALQREDEVEHLLRATSHHPKVRVLRAPALPGGRRRSRWERAFLRRENFAHHFAGCERETICLDNEVTLRRTFFRTGEICDCKVRSRLSDVLQDCVVHAELLPECFWQPWRA